MEPRNVLLSVFSATTFITPLQMKNEITSTYTSLFIVRQNKRSTSTDDSGHIESKDDFILLPIFFFPKRPTNRRQEICPFRTPRKTVEKASDILKSSWTQTEHFGLHGILITEIRQPTWYKHTVFFCYYILHPTYQLKTKILHHQNFAPLSSH